MLEDNLYELLDVYKWKYNRFTYGKDSSRKRYILETVLDHLPFVTVAERNINVYIIQKDGYNISSSHTEFGEWDGYKNWKTLSTEVQDDYILVVDGSLREIESLIRLIKSFRSGCVGLLKE